MLGLKLECCALQSKALATFYTAVFGSGTAKSDKSCDSYLTHAISIDKYSSIIK